MTSKSLHFHKYMLEKIYPSSIHYNTFAQKEIGIKEKQIIMGVTFRRAYIRRGRYTFLDAIK